MGHDCVLGIQLLRQLVAATVACSVAAGIARAQFDPPDPPSTQPIFVDPIEPGLSPIALPPLEGFVPPRGTVSVPTPPTGVPTDIPPLAGFAEQTIVNVMTPFASAHPNSELTVTSVEGAGSYAVTIALNDGDDFAVYPVSETLDLVSVGYLMHDGARSELLASADLIGTLDGGLVWAKFQNDLLSSLKVVTQISGVKTTWDYPGGAVPQPGLASAAQLQSLFSLVDAHLTGPARTPALETYHSALGGYIAATTPTSADFNQDGIIDAADYVVWRKNDGTQAGYNNWRSHFGQSADGGSGASANAAVPEPATSMLLMFAASVWYLRQRRPA